MRLLITQRQVMIPARFAVLAVSLLLMTLAACGGSSETAEEAPAPPVATAASVGDVDIEATVEARVAAELATAVSEATPMTSASTPEAAPTPATTTVAVTPAPTVAPTISTSTPTPAPTVATMSKLNVTQSISGGYYYTCALRENGEAECWGDTRFGAATPPDGRYTAISAGDYHACGLRESGQAVCWGDNDYGQADSGGRRFKVISAGKYHTCALRDNGDVECWGDNKYGQLYAPDGRYISISAGGSHTCALRDNGDVECWGLNDHGQSVVVEGENFVAISAGRNHNCALRKNGTGACWGGKNSNKHDIGILLLDGPFTAISAGNDFSCALNKDGDSICWGNNDEDQLDAPHRIHFAAIAASRSSHTCALRQNGTAVCWGFNHMGQSTPPPGSFAQPSAGNITITPSPSDSFDTASVLARFSTTDPVEGETRANAASEIIAQYRSGKADRARVLELLHTVVPELSIDQRRRAADEFARLSNDDQWDKNETASAVFHLASLITGDEPNYEESIAAANDLVTLYKAGELDSGRALGLMNTIAPGLSINDRRQAADALARLSEDDSWSDTDIEAAANEAFRLVTGVPLKTEERIEAAVDLAGLGVKLFDKEGHFDDKDIAVATEIVKQYFKGELTTESIQEILGLK